MSTSIRFSMDFELAWGVAESGAWKGRQAAGVYTDLHKEFRKLVDLFTSFEVPVTWATVGSMVVEPGSWEYEHLPDNAISYLKEFTKECHPDSIDGRRLFDMVVSGGKNHTVGCHTYSHTRFDFPQYTEESVKEDLLLARKVLGEESCDSNCLVLPQNIEHNLGALPKAGILHCRTAPSDRANNRYIRKFANMVGVIPASVSWFDNEVDYNSGSMFFNSSNTKSALAHLALVLRAATIRSIRNGTDLHFWAHPFNFSMNPGLFKVADDYFRWLSKFREELCVECIHWNDVSNMKVRG